MVKISSIRVLRAVWLALIALAAALSARAESARPATKVDGIFYRYAADCVGMDWHFLRAVARAENKTQSEANTAATATWLHHFLTGKPNLGEQAEFLGVLDVCRNVTIPEAVALAYMGKEGGAGMLEHALQTKSCKAPEVRKAIESFYQSNPTAAKRVAAEYEQVLSRSPAFGGAENIYIPGAVKTSACPAASRPADPAILARLDTGVQRLKTRERALAGLLRAPPWEGGSPENATGTDARAESLPAPISRTPAQRARLPKNLQPFAAAPPPPANFPSAPATSLQTKGIHLWNRLTLPKIVRIAGHSASVGLVTFEEVNDRKDFEFGNRTADAKIRVATYSDGTKVEIVEPKKTDAGFHNYTTAVELADAARYLPASSRALITRIIVSPGANPHDAYWAKEYKMPNFRSSMSASADGVVEVYPRSVKTFSDRARACLENYLKSDDTMRGALIHETGHIFAAKNWGEDYTKGKWSDWRKAAEGDVAWVSKYAQASPHEDFAETFTAYASSKGTPRFEKFKVLVPRRFAILDREVK